MSVERNLPLVRERRQAALQGDQAEIKRQHDAGKLTARERVTRLFDEGSFVELDTLIAEGGVITGRGTVLGQGVYVYAQDFTVKGGAVGAAQAGKILKVLSLAEKTGCPVIAIMDSYGARLDEGMAAVNAYASIMAKSADLSGVIPQIALVLGPCGGGAAMCAAMSDIVIVGKAGQLFVNGPQFVSAQLGKNITMEEMAGPAASVKSGAAHIAAGSDEEAIECARDLVGMLPANNLDSCFYMGDTSDDADRPLTGFDAIDTVTEVRDLIKAVADDGEVVELGETFAPEIVTALARVAGTTVGFVATQGAKDGGRLTVEGCRKAARFVRFLDSFSIPAVTLADTQGSAANTAAQGELALAGAALLSAYASSTNARIAIVTGSAIGTSATALASHAVSDVIYAWPGAVISAVTAPVAVQLLYEKELHDAQDPQAKRAELEAAYQDGVADGVNAALQGCVDDVIEPNATRRVIAEALDMLSDKRESKPARKHSNLPL